MPRNVEGIRRIAWSEMGGGAIDDPEGEGGTAARTLAGWWTGGGWWDRGGAWIRRHAVFMTWPSGW